MGARELLAELQAAGVSVLAAGDRLVIRPASRLSNCQREALRDAKPEMLVMLGTSAPPAHAPARHHREPWDDATCARFVARVALFLRRGLHAGEADDLAERLVLRDQDRDDRRICLECTHLRGAARCATARRAGVAPVLPPDLMRQLQRCPAFEEVLP